MMFTDVSRDHKDWDAINYVVDTGLMGGYPDGSFQPDNNVQWGELCKILAEMFAPKDEMISFLPGHWALGYAEYCKKRELISDNIDISRSHMNKYITISDLCSVFDHLAKMLRLSINTIKYEHAISGGMNNLSTRMHLASLLYIFAKVASHEVYLYINSSDESSEIEIALDLLNTHRKFGYYKNYKRMLPTDIAYAYDKLCEMESSNNTLAFYYLIKIIKFENSSINGFHKLSENDSVFHYTKLKVLNELTKSNAKLRLHPTAYLNDPSEGKEGLEVARKIFSEDSYNGFFSDWSLDDTQSAFIASFVTYHEEKSRSAKMSSRHLYYHNRKSDIAQEDLPMWVHYGDECKGCEIEFKVADLGTDVYKVYYPKTRGRGTGDFIHSLRKIKHILDLYWAEASQHRSFNPEDDSVFRVTKDMIARACFLYKTAQYSYEQEARIIQFRSLEDAKMCDDCMEGESFPRIYDELDVPLNFTSITLGPKVENPERVIIALVNRGIPRDKIHISTIPYR